MGIKKTALSGKSATDGKNPVPSSNKSSILTVEERNLVLHKWNSTSRDYDLSLCLHELFEKQAADNPKKTAVVFRNISQSYEELNIRANCLAHELINSGVKPDSLVAVYMERSVEMIISLMAVLKSGGAYLPINPELPEQRILFITEDAEPAVILTQSHLIKNFPDTGIKMIAVDKEIDFSGRTNSANPCSGVSPKDLAYCIYTSGSTGKPKGVLINHESICNRLLWMQECFQIEANDRILQKTPFDFDVSVWEFFWPLLNGAALVVADPGSHRDSGYLTEIINEQKITVIHFVPAMLDIFLREPDLSQCSSLRYVICSGEALSFSLQERFFSKMSCELYNLYGPTEAAVDVTYWKCDSGYQRKTVPIGFPVSNTRMYILDGTLNPVPPETEGDLYIGGIQLARGYLKRDELTSERFITDPFSSGSNDRIYKTGDIAKWNADGAIEYIGRSDFQIKFNGLRIETGEIEYLLEKHPAITSAIVNLKADDEDKKLVAYYTLKTDLKCSITELKDYLKKFLSQAVIPTHYVELTSFPLTSSGKIDRKQLPAPVRPQSADFNAVSVLNDLEKQIHGIWKEILSLENIDRNSNFFDIGGTSLKATLLAVRLREHFSQDISVVQIFQHPTIHMLAKIIGDVKNEIPLLQTINERIKKEKNCATQSRGIAIIGMSGRFPGAESIEELWENICAGKETVTQFSRDELDEVDAELANDPFYIPARGILTDIDKFDAPFFGISPNEAMIMDPQQRLMLETAWAALENAGYSSQHFKGSIGVYAGMGDSSYYLNYVHERPDLVNRVGAVTVEIGTEKDHIAPRISFMMNLHGPSLSIHTGCSTALVVVDAAVNALLAYQCDMAMAGGIDVSVPQKSGQLYQEDGIFTKDGHCRPFDSGATGTMFGEAVGMVVLKRLEDALADNDTIHAVILGTAVNHDGSNKASYLAPSADGQAEVIGLAQARAGVHPESIGFIEAHGTATPIGDPIEVAGLTKAFRLKTAKNQYCALGSIKGNLGHTTNAAGITGLIKAVKTVKHKMIPPSINYENSNPAIDFTNSPFFINTQIMAWPENMLPARAGVSSFGYCGTNVHTILQEPPETAESSASRSKQLVMLSAKTESSLKRMTDNLADFLRQNPGINIADAAYTLHRGRSYFQHRKYMICSDSSELLSQIEKPDPNMSGQHYFNNTRPQIIFMFPGQGSQYVNMGKTLYRDEAVFRNSIDLCASILQKHTGEDIRLLLFPEKNDEEKATISLKETKHTQPAIFIIEYALAQLWIYWGISPDAMIGHSIGEFVCACLAGIFSLEDALLLVAARGKLMQDLPGGTMLSVLADEDTVRERLPEDISIAAVNASNLCVISGPDESVKNFDKLISSEGIVTKELHSSHAFHSSMMDPVVEPFEKLVSSVSLSKPDKPFISTVTGKWITSSEAVDPYYWANHLRATVNFAAAVSEILDENPKVLLEVGPRATSATLARKQITDFTYHQAIPSLGSSSENETEWISVLKAVGMLWQRGIYINSTRFFENETRKRIQLPAYSFEKIRYWIDPVNSDNKFTRKKHNITQEVVMHADSKQNSTFAKTETGSTQITGRVKDLIESICGKSVPDAALNTTFSELGFDSLILTQITRNLAKEFKLQISFRQLMENLSTITLLAEYINSSAPAEILVKFTSPLTQSSDINTSRGNCSCSDIPPLSADAASGNLESIILRQMNLIERLVSLLEKQGGTLPLAQGILSETENREKSSDSSPSENAKIMNSANPPVPGARLGKDEDGNPAWYVPDPADKSKYRKLENL